jgi:hypothetical protein
MFALLIVIAALMFQYPLDKVEGKVELGHYKRHLKNARMAAEIGF